MKPLKRTVQKYLRVNTYYYREEDLKLLLREGKIDDLHGNYVVFTSSVKDIRVVLDDFGFYETVAILNSGSAIHVSL